MKKKKRKHSHNSQQRTTSSFQPLTDSESSSSRENIRRDFGKSRVFGVKGPILLEIPGKEKMSEVLMNFARPYLDKYGTGTGASERIIALAVVAWNMAIIPQSEKRAMVEKVLRVFPASQRSTAESLLCLMEDRKRKHFNEIKRYIVNYKVKDSPDSINVFVASTPSPDQMAEIRKNSGKLVSTNPESIDVAKTEICIDGKHGDDGSSDHKMRNPQQQFPKMQRIVKARSMLSKILFYCLGRWKSKGQL